MKHSQRDFLQGLSAKAAIGKAKVFLKLLVHGVFLKLLVHGVYKKFFALASSKEFLDTQVAIECGFTLKRLRDMTRTYRKNLCCVFSCPLPFSVFEVFVF